MFVFVISDEEHIVSNEYIIGTTSLKKDDLLSQYRGNPFILYYRESMFADDVVDTIHHNYVEEDYDDWVYAPFLLPKYINSLIENEDSFHHN